MTENNTSMIYKYKTADSAKTMLKNNDLWFSVPDVLNDPFDAKVHTVFAQGTEEDWLKYLQYVTLKKENPKKIIIQQMKNAEAFQWDTRNAKTDVMANLKTKPFIFSASNTRTENLLWSHYAQEHKGICLGFKTIQIDSERKKLRTEKIDSNFTKDNFLTFRNIDYSKLSNTQTAFLDLNIVKDIFDEGKLIEPLIVKHSYWKYEEETRSVILEPHITQYKNKKVMNKDNEKEVAGINIKFAKETLKEIIFGLKCPEETKTEIKQVVIDSNYDLDNITFKQIRKSDTEYKLYTEDIEI